MNTGHLGSLATLRPRGILVSLLGGACPLAERAKAGALDETGHTAGKLVPVR